MKNLIFKKILSIVTFQTKKIILFCFIAIFTIAMIYVFWGRKFYVAYKQYCLWKSNRLILEEKIKKLNISIYQKKYFIKKLMTDRSFREFVAHEQNGFLNTNEYVIYFKTNEELNINTESVEKN